MLANEQVVDGRCERCGTEVEQRQLTQWFLRITDYAQALLDDMSELVDWPERVLTMQRNWIGRSEGARVVFRLDDGSQEIPVFTTRPDTLFGATFFVLAPEHPLVGHLVEGRPEEAAVREYAAAAARASAADRGDADRPKTGVFTGRHVVNPVNGEPIPVWVADYVLMDYGTGAIMAVPAHDERDFAFAHGARAAGAPGDRGRGRRRGHAARGGLHRARARWSPRASSTGSARARRSPRRRPGCRRTASARRRSATGCATG